MLIDYDRYIKLNDDALHTLNKIPYKSVEGWFKEAADLGIELPKEVISKKDFTYFQEYINDYYADVQSSIHHESDEQLIPFLTDRLNSINALQKRIIALKDIQRSAQTDTEFVKMIKERQAK